MTSRPQERYSEDARGGLPRTAPPSCLPRDALAVGEIAQRAERGRRLSLDSGRELRTIDAAIDVLERKAAQRRATLSTAETVASRLIRASASRKTRRSGSLGDYALMWTRYGDREELEIAARVRKFAVPHRPSAIRQPEPAATALVLEAYVQAATRAEKRPRQQGPPPESRSARRQRRRTRPNPTPPEPPPSPARQRPQQHGAPRSQSHPSAALAVPDYAWGRPSAPLTPEIANSPKIRARSHRGSIPVRPCGTPPKNPYR